jgi:hypothetical protein
LLTALSPVLLSLTNLKFLDLSPTIGIGRAQLQEELTLCQTWSKVCGLNKVVFPSGDVWILSTASLVKTDDGCPCWVLAGGTTATRSTTSSWEDRAGNYEFEGMHFAVGPRKNLVFVYAFFEFLGVW